APRQLTAFDKSGNGVSSSDGNMTAIFLGSDLAHLDTAPFTFSGKAAVTMKGGQNFIINNPHPAAGLASLTVDSGTTNTLVNVWATGAGVQTTVTQTNGAPEIVYIGLPHGDGTYDVRSIFGSVTINNAGSHQATLAVFNTGDAVGRAALISDTAIFHLAPAPIYYAPGSLAGLSIYGGAGGNLFSVTATGAGYTTLAAGGKGRGIVNVGSQYDVPGIVDYVRGNLIVTDDDHLGTLVVDDSANFQNKYGAHDASIVTGLNMGGTITYYVGSLADV